MSHIQNLLDQIKRLENRLVEEVARESEDYGYRIHEGKPGFDKAIVKQHQRLSKRLWQYFSECSLLELLAAPVVYSLVIPLLVFDLFIWCYQATCFTVYGIPKVRRSDYIAYDRHHLKYLNLIERFNCAYCSYANGFIAYAQEVAARSEQYWCPIKHARQLKSIHSRYNGFVAYGDAEGYVTKSQQLRNTLNDDGNE